MGLRKYRVYFSFYKKYSPFEERRTKIVKGSSFDFVYKELCAQCEMNYSSYRIICIQELEEEE